MNDVDTFSCSTSDEIAFMLLCSPCESPVVLWGTINTAIHQPVHLLLHLHTVHRTKTCKVSKTIYLASIVWDICKQCRPRPDAAECGV